MNGRRTGELARIALTLTVPVETVGAVTAAVRHLEVEANRPVEAVAVRPSHLMVEEALRRRQRRRATRTKDTATSLPGQRAPRARTPTIRGKEKPREGTADGGTPHTGL